jgi:hypothetical protein
MSAKVISLATSYTLSASADDEYSVAYIRRNGESFDSTSELRFESSLKFV